MNKNNYAILILIIAVAAAVSYGVGTTVLGNRTKKPVDVEDARLISTEITKPEKNVFALDAINPTVKIIIGDNNQNPIGN